MCQICSALEKGLGSGFHLFIISVVMVVLQPLLYLFYHCTSSTPYRTYLSKVMMNACSTPPLDSSEGDFVPVTQS